MGLRVRAGVHSGEVERDTGNLRGAAVHAVTRIAALANSGEVLVSAPTASLLEGAGLKWKTLASTNSRDWPAPAASAGSSSSTPMRRVHALGSLSAMNESAPHSEIHHADGAVSNGAGARDLLHHGSRPR